MNYQINICEEPAYHGWEWELGRRKLAAWHEECRMRREKKSNIGKPGFCKDCGEKLPKSNRLGWCQNCKIFHASEIEAVRRARISQTKRGEQT